MERSSDFFPPRNGRKWISKGGSPRDLSAALLAVEWEPGALGAALDGYFDGKRRRLLKKLFAALLVAHGEAAYSPSPSILIRFLLQQEEFLRLAASLKSAGEPSRFSLGPPVFAPSARFRSLPVPPLATQGELAQWLGLTVRELDWFVDARNTLLKTDNPKLHHYDYRFVVKSHGPPRLLEAPKARLKEIQRLILRDILDHVAAHPAAHGFVAGRSCITGASIHAGEDIVIGLDLKDFFLSAPIPRVRAMFRHLGYPHAAAGILTRLCATSTPMGVFERLPFEQRHDWATRKRFEGLHLPQGAPTSPALANLVSFWLDVRLAGLARRFGANYTRYADDLAFSGDAGLARGSAAFLKAIAEVVVDEGFTLNPRKTRIMSKRLRQRLTGLVVNDHVNVSRETYDRLKAILHNCAKSGLEAENREGVANFRAHLDGRIGWVEQVNPTRGAKLRAIFDRLPLDAR